MNIQKTVNSVIGTAGIASAYNKRANDAKEAEIKAQEKELTAKAEKEAKEAKEKAQEEFKKFPYREAEGTAVEQVKKEYNPYAYDNKDKGLDTSIVYPSSPYVRNDIKKGLMARDLSKQEASYFKKQREELLKKWQELQGRTK